MSGLAVAGINGMRRAGERALAARDH
jgi:hypothetical protein